jgi:hypothetical protein
VGSQPRRARYLDPASRLGEVLFGLIMVLSITLSARLTVAEGRQGMTQLVIAALGCNLAWALIDAIMYVMGNVTERAEKARMIREVHGAPGEDAALALIRDTIEPRFEVYTRPQFRETLVRAIREYLRESEPPGIGVSAEDLKGAAACFALVFLSCLPVVLLYLVMPDPVAAVRASNVLLIAMLFAAGFLWGRFAHVNAWAAGAAMVAIGLALVGVAVALGG